MENTLNGSLILSVAADVVSFSLLYEIAIPMVNYIMCVYLFINVLRNDLHLIELNNTSWFFTIQFLIINVAPIT